MTVLYFGPYNPNYSRNRVLMKGLRENGVNVIECNDRSRSFFKYIKLFFKYLRMKPKHDVMIVGFPGQEAMLLARFLTKKPIIFDTFTSHFGGYILDRGKYSPKSLRAKWYRWIDKKSVELSSISLLDTDAHIDFFVSEFNLSREKFKRIFVGTDSSIFYPRSVKKNTDKFLVHFHGNYIPLQGVKYIIQAAKLLENKNITFNLIGKGQTFGNDKKLADELNVKNINFISRVSYKKLSDYVNMADISLGIFGDTLKTRLVIPNKVFEAIACKKATITSDTKAARELFKDEDNILFCKKADVRDLADKILKLKHDDHLRNKIAGRGYETFQNECHEKILGEQLIKIIK